MTVHELCSHIETVLYRMRPCKTVNNRSGPCMIGVISVASFNITNEQLQLNRGCFFSPAGYAS